MNSGTRKVVSALFTMALFATGGGDAAHAQDSKSFDPAPAWPLCGRIADNPPAGWTATDGCPSERWGDPDHADYPMSTSFGPRILPSENDRFDFHRGIDLPTAVGTPVFAMAAGLVRTAGNHSAYDGPLVQIRHYRPESPGECRPDGCYHTMYLHLSSVEVSRDEMVRKGQLIGYTGTSDSGFDHLHFGVRNARPEDPFSSWQRDAIHPLRVLPYHSNTRTTQVTIIDVDDDVPQSPRVKVHILQPAADRPLDINRIEVEIYDNGDRSSVAQASLLPDANGFHTHQPYIDFEQRNFEYSHKNSSSFPWSSFGSCPYGDDHGPSYNANVHVCTHDPQDNSIGDFNGIRLQPALITSGNLSSYELTAEFTELVGVDDAADLCVVVTVANARGGQGLPATWNCSF